MLRKRNTSPYFLANFWNGCNILWGFYFIKVIFLSPSISTYVSLSVMSLCTNCELVFAFCEGVVLLVPNFIAPYSYIYGSWRNGLEALNIPGWYYTRPSKYMLFSCYEFLFVPFFRKIGWQYISTYWYIGLFSVTYLLVRSTDTYQYIWGNFHHISFPNIHPSTSFLLVLKWVALNFLVLLFP